MDTIPSRHDAPPAARAGGAHASCAGVARFGRPPAPRAGLFARLIETLLLWQSRASERHRLQSLDDRLLRDVGLTRADVEREAAKPFWRA